MSFFMDHKQQTLISPTIEKIIILSERKESSNLINDKSLVSRDHKMVKTCYSIHVSSNS